jgi:2-polyprenyl-3-methyl-5-hydroxy-6-metoxy-1,4-benzoquinol methylase
VAPSQYSGHYFDEEAPNNSWSNLYRYVPRGSRVLDVGCATGNFGAALQELKDCTVVGVDLNESDVREAATKISAAYVLDITDDGISERLGTFDVVVFADVLEHLVDARAAMRAVHSLLNEGGVVLYSIPNMGHLSVRLDLLEGLFPYTELGLLDRTHLHFYDRLEVHDLFAAAGFRITDESPVERGYPHEWIAERLAAVGMTATPQFFSVLQRSDAHIFQYVGVAAPSETTPPLPSRAGGTVTPVDDLLEHANRIVAENAKLKHELGLLEARITVIRSKPLRSIVRALRWRVLNRLRRQANG